MDSSVDNEVSKACSQLIKYSCKGNCSKCGKTVHLFAVVSAMNDEVLISAIML